MDATEASVTLVEWAVETCADLNNVYECDPARIQHALPIAVADIGEEAVVRSDPTLGIEIADLGLEQGNLHVLRSSIALMVDDTADDSAAKELEALVAKLGAAIATDETLGGRVHAVSPFWRASYEPPFVEFDDGTKGRMATFSLAIAELI